MKKLTAHWQYTDSNGILNFCSRCAGSHGPNDPCPAQAGLPGQNRSVQQPFFQFNNIAGASQKPEETDNDHILRRPTWTCPDCNTVNDEDQFPIKCSICRRGRP